MIYHAARPKLKLINLRPPKQDKLQILLLFASTWQIRIKTSLNCSCSLQQGRSSEYQINNLSTFHRNQTRMTSFVIHYWPIADKGHFQQQITAQDTKQSNVGSCFRKIGQVRGGYLKVAQSVVILHLLTKHSLFPHGLSLAPITKPPSVIDPIATTAHDLRKGYQSFETYLKREKSQDSFSMFSSMKKAWQKLLVRNVSKVQQDVENKGMSHIPCHSALSV